MPENTMPAKPTAHGILLLVAVLALLVRLVWAYGSWPLACLPLAVWVVMVLLRGVRDGLAKS